MKKGIAYKKSCFFKYWKLFLFVVLLILIFIGAVFVFAYGNPAEGFRVNASTFSEVNASGMCIEVNATTYTGSDFFVPSATSAELNAFYNNLPSGVSSSSCNSYPPRIAYYSGQVNQYTDPNTGEWKTDPDCSSGATIDNTTYCYDRYPEANTHDSAYYTYEFIYDWKSSGCTGSDNRTKPSVRCRLCNIDYTYPSACESAPGYGCVWHPYGYACARQECYNYFTSSTCGNAGCYWDGSNCVISPDGCNYFTDQSDCEYEMDCGWEEDSFCCYEIYGTTCSNYYNQWDCEMFACQWDTYNGRCHEICT